MATNGRDARSKGGDPHGVGWIEASRSPPDWRKGPCSAAVNLWHRRPTPFVAAIRGTRRNQQALTEASDRGLFTPPRHHPRSGMTWPRDGVALRKRALPGHL